MWKKKAKIVLLIICMLVVVYLIYLQRKLSATILFSHDSGFYSDAFMLTLESNEAYILRYTLDGSIPDETSPIYEGPILMEDASTHENIYSTRTDTSAGFEADSGYVVPNYLVDKCNVVRAALFDVEGTCVNEASQVYFVGFDEKNSYVNLPIISIVTDPDNLFDYYYGIYVKGAIYDEAGNNESWRTRKANYNARGYEWEREAYVNIFDENRNLLESCKAGIRIHGGNSRAHAQKSLNLYARRCYSGSDSFETDLFNNGKGSHKMILGAQGNDDKVKIKNYMVQKLAIESNSNCATMKMVPYILFLDGEYWGLYYLSESYDADYISTHYNVNEDDIVMFKNSALEEGRDEDYQLQWELTTFISNNDMRIPENYERACEIIDMESFIDYYALEIYVANQDWLPNNCAYWRTREKDLRNQYYDSKWRWMLFDTDLWAILLEADDDTIGYAIEKDSVFASLVQNEEVQEMLRRRLLELQDIYEENCDEWINEWLLEMSSGVYQNGERFWGEDAIDDYVQSMIDDMRAFPEKREWYLDQYMKQHFQSCFY